MSNANVSFKYNISEDELKIVTPEPEKSSKKSDDEQSKSEKVQVSLIDKYFKSFKNDKNIDDSKINSEKDISEKKLSERENRESSRSPIKGYFNKLSKKSDIVDTLSDSDVVKDSKEKDLQFSERWKLFNEIKGKITQVVEEKIKSSKPEGIERNNSLDNSSLTDSEENSIQQDLDHSCASTENQVSSLASSVQNLSDLSPPLISQSNTIMDSQEDHSSSSNVTNKNIKMSAKAKTENEDKRANADLLDDDDNIDLEIESGVDALEDFNLVEIKEDNTMPIDTNIDKRYQTDNKKQSVEKKSFFTYTLLSFTSLILASFAFMSTFLLFNGFLLGVWFVYFANNLYHWLLDYFGYNKVNDDKYNFDLNAMKLTKINQIVEFEPLKKYEGWINIYTLGNYDPMTYHISDTQTVFLKLEGCHLRLSHSSNKVSRRAHWDENITNVDFYQHKLYNLEGAKIKLLPVGIVKKRYWSKKYPICIVLKDKSKVVIYNAQSTSFDTSASLASKDDSKASDNESTPKKQKSDEPGSSKKINKKLISLDGNIEKTSIFEAIKEYHHSPKKVPKCEDEKSDSEFLDADDEFENSTEDPPIDTTMMCTTATNDLSNEDLKEVDDEEASDFNIEDGKWSKNEVQNLSEEETVLYLFARTGRDKDEWFHRLKTAIEDADTKGNLKSAINSSSNQDEDTVDYDVDFIKSDKTNDFESKVQLSSTKIEKKLIGSSDMPSVLWTPGKVVKESLLTEAFHSVQDVDFWKYMKDILKNKESISDMESMTSDLTWLNALMGRFIYDTFRNPVWVSDFQDRIQRKLSTLKLPSFMGPLVITALDLGCDAPKFHDVLTPVLDARGVWIYFQMSYTGHAMMTLTTQLNLMSLKEKKSTLGDETTQIPFTTVSKRSDGSLAVYDSDIEDSAESSSEDEAGPSQSFSLKTTDTENLTATSPNPRDSSTKKLLRFVDKIAANKYFQHVTEYKYVKRAMEGVSNTDLKLSVELKGLSGCLAVNVPPSPSDRFWFGFKGNPNLCLKAKPIVGSHVINFTHVTNWIEKRLSDEFEKLLVLPNMEDINLDCMMSPSIN